MLPEYCRIGTEPSISEVIFYFHMEFARNEYASGKHACTDQNGEMDSTKLFLSKKKTATKING